MEMNFFRTILNKIKDRIRNTNIRLEKGMGEIRNDIKKSRSRWFVHVMQMREERIPNKMLHTKME